MTRLYLTVEGQTEQEFAVQLLCPHLARFGVNVFKPRLTGLHARRKGRIPRGGLKTTIVHSLGDIRRWMKQDQSPDAVFSMMVDLYSLPSDSPGYDDAMAIKDPYEQVKALELALAEHLADSRFIPYFQLHEFEALVLSKPAVFLDWFDGAEKAVKQLVAECERFDTPERIDHDQHSHPKARILNHIADYDAGVDGPALAKLIGLEAIRACCPHFDEWLSKLERLDAPS